MFTRPEPFSVEWFSISVLRVYNPTLCGNKYHFGVQTAGQVYELQVRLKSDYEMELLVIFWYAIPRPLLRRDQ
jgi:hypothetical protein